MFCPSFFAHAYIRSDILLLDHYPSSIILLCLCTIIRSLPSHLPSRHPLLYLLDLHPQHHLLANPLTLLTHFDKAVLNRSPTPTIDVLDHTYRDRLLGVSV